MVMEMELLQLHELRQEQFSLMPMVPKADFERLKIEMIGYKTKAHYWETQFKRLKNKEKGIALEWESQFQDLKTREEQLALENAELKAKLKKREQQLFGKTSEASDANEKSEKEKPRNKRGQQIGKPGLSRRSYSHLPSVNETVSLLADETVCSCCGAPYHELSATEDSEILEIINVKAYRRLIRRKKYQRACHCSQNPAPKIITTPAINRLLPKSKFGISIWAFLLLQKYEYQQPLYRVFKQLSANGLDLSAGSITDGLKKIMPLLTPIYDAIQERSISAHHWHADETGWKVFEMLEGKITQRWYLWIFSNAETVVYKLDPTRSAKVLNEYFKNNASGILNVDRYSAYKVIAKTGFFILAFCWAHVRRDFLSHSKGYPEQDSWGLDWVTRINHLYHINNKRIAQENGSKEFKQQDTALKQAIADFKSTLDAQLVDEKLPPSALKILNSLDNHWDGLTIFINQPNIPMDNNIAERGLRSPVVGRKGYYGSGAIWSGELAALMFTIFATLKCWRLNSHTWLIAYFQACASAGKVPDNYQAFLPWNMTEAEKILFSAPPAGENSS